MTTKLYVEMVDGKIVDAKRHKTPIMESTNRLATEEEIKTAKIEFGYLKRCKVHLVYDEPGFIYDTRVCGICGTVIGLI